ncbi:hypothetical protein AKJ40_00670 [candidate division MSBL1 archaeon SCGC-AAA259M10]|uniref:Uncharacterized protein n=1 Tax=candidate division MSBL1 archaeon SCGC-AAA259M10 TaxID=1698270 RepID=A0A133V2V1_9EURY|nr:hypothetical protein AKJ40_00670 [candidate division MSBL1 archaeon SCGC-AAA259M10]
MTVRETSIEAFYNLPDLAERQRQVLRGFKLWGPGTDFEITVALNKHRPEYWYPNRVRPRRKELQDMGLIREIGKRECEVTGRTAIVREVSPLGRRMGVVSDG